MVQGLGPLPRGDRNTSCSVWLSLSQGYHPHTGVPGINKHVLYHVLGRVQHLRDASEPGHILRVGVLLL